MRTWLVGDTLIGTRDHNRGIRRRIVAARATGYTWVYPELPDSGPFESENSTDPRLELGWELEARMGMDLAPELHPREVHRDGEEGDRFR